MRTLLLLGILLRRLTGRSSALRTLQLLGCVLLRLLIFLCGSSGGCARCAVTRSVQVAYDIDQYLWYFSSAVFLSACFLLRYHNAVRHVRFPQLIHFMLQLVKGSVVLPFFFGRRTIFLFCFLSLMHVVSLGLQCLTVKHRRSHFASSVLIYLSLGF